MAKTTHGRLAPDAAAYLAGSSDAVESLDATPQEIDRQAGRLVEWARERNVVLDDDYTAGLVKHESATAEHEVFYRAADNRAVKRTHAGTFGVTTDTKGHQRHATPLFYLRRLELMNRIFDADLRLEGMAFGKSLILGVKEERPCMVISQPWHKAAAIEDPHPSEAEIEQFMESLGFNRMDGSYFGWFRKDGNVTVSDARPDNFIKSPFGVIPIDLVMSEKIRR